ncbi:RNA polymerase sigma factor [Reticulibacter mediterranei]|uniref:RNA polymerase sigma factor n=1 Tax=Reticulibacter mediterranei TaxID=2778369 RepID=A0A8J3IYH4_9CHLR|nr:sigma-70 family RNA polymerase sigma factor [Reticulibacter mediterranei]GHP00829.1 RNA polymerase sigma factor [Reticulibacter mediterranei]
MSLLEEDISSEDFEAGVLAQLDSLSRKALSLTRNPQEAEDLVQETMLKAFRFAHLYQPDTNLRAWLFRILNTSAINHYRKQATQPLRLPDQEVDGSHMSASFPDSEYIVLCQELSDEVWHALKTLSPLSLSILLRFSEGMSTQEIATALCIPKGTVLSRLHRTRQTLRKQLAGYAIRMGYQIKRAKKQRVLCKRAMKLWETSPTSESTGALTH